MRSNILLFFQQRCCSLHVWVDSLFHPQDFIFSGFQNETKATLPGRLQYILCLHMHTYRHKCLYCSQRLNFGPKPCLLSELPSAVEWNKMCMPVFFSVILRLIQYLPASYTHLSSSHSWPTHQLITTFPIKKHVYLMSTFYSESYSEQREARMELYIYIYKS